MVDYRNLLNTSHCAVRRARLLREIFAFEVGEVVLGEGNSWEAPLLGAVMNETVLAYI
jgi:hypothetical protein